MINSCISHEMMNPINSITAQNVLESELLVELKGVIDHFSNFKRIEDP